MSHNSYIAVGDIMHGLVNRSIECFVRDAYGQMAWEDVARCAGLEPATFESMLHYNDQLTHAVLEAISQRLNKPREAVLEDVGTYLVTHSNTKAIRRLLRFSGDSFGDFLASLDDLPERVKLAVPDLEFPRLELEERGNGQFCLWVRGAHAEFIWVICGAMRALADDYGALVLMEGHDPVGGTDGFIELHLAALSFAEGNAFSLGAGGAN